MPVGVRKEVFGKTTDGRDVHKYTFEGSCIEVSVLDFGCAISNILVPDREGRKVDVSLGVREEFPQIGVVVGRVAGRIANGKFGVDDKVYPLVVNNGPNNIHGGITGFSRRLWNGTIDGNKLTLTYFSPDGEDDFPGDVTAHVTYSLTPEGALTIDYSATTTKPCPINLTNHSYFNLAGHVSPLMTELSDAVRKDNSTFEIVQVIMEHASLYLQDNDSVLDHVALIKADTYVPVDEVTLIPTGDLLSVEGSPVDLRKPTRLGDREAAIRKGDLDITYCLETKGDLKHVARISHPASGRFVDANTNVPGLQFYTSKYMTDAVGKGDKVYQPFCAFCLETQHYPDSVNHANFPNTILRLGETYRQTTVFTFGVDNEAK